MTYLLADTIDSYENICRSFCIRKGTRRFSLRKNFDHLRNYFRACLFSYFPRSHENDTFSLPTSELIPMLLPTFSLSVLNNKTKYKKNETKIAAKENFNFLTRFTFHFNFSHPLFPAPPDQPVERRRAEVIRLPVVICHEARNKGGNTLLGRSTRRFRIRVSALWKLEKKIYTPIERTD